MMKKFGRKTIVSLLAISMFSAVLPLAAMAAPTTDGHYIKLEESDYSNREAGFSQNNSVASMSGGKVRVNWANTYGELDFTVDIPSAGQYTIWVYGGESGNTYVSPSKLILDNTTDLDWEVVQGGTQESGMSIKTAYHKVTATLTAGTHTLKYILTGPRPADSTYAGAFDFMMIIPSGYKWTPSKTDLPVAEYKSFTEGGYAWLEELDYSNREAGFSQNNSVASMSGGKVRVNWATTYGELDFTVNIPDTGEYTIWVYGGDSDNENVSPSKLILDNTTDLNWESILGGTTESGMSVRTAYHSVNTTLTAGVHTFKYILTDHRPADNYYAGAFDFMVIMPSNYVWTPSKTEFPAEPTAADLCIKLEESDYSNREAGFSQNNSVETMSGGKVRVNWATTYGELDFTVNIHETREYTIWVYGGDSSNDSVSPSKLVLDNTTDLNWESIQGGTTESGMSIRTAYHSVNTTLTAGVHTFKYILTDHRPADNYYAGAFDFMLIMPSNYIWTPSKTELPTPPVNTYYYEYGYAWIEGESAVTGFTSKTDREEFSNGTAYQLATKDSPSVAEDGHYVEYDVDLKAGTYDIYFRAVDDAFALNSAKTASYMSDAHTYVDGAEKSYTNILSEGWGTSFTTSLSNYAHGWLKVSGVELSEDTHTVRLAYLETATANTSWYFGGLDCIAIVPSGSQFVPVEKDIDATKLDSEMSVLLSDYNLQALKDSITMPSTTLGGESITWTSSDPSAVAIDGTVTRSETADKSATLTAATDSYTKVFAVKVKQITDFDVSSFTKSGSIGLGKTLSANATLSCNKGASKDATIVIALYDKNNRVLLVGIDTKPVTNTDTDIGATITIPSDYAEDLTGSYVKAFLWSDLTPIESVFKSFSDDFVITELGNNVDFHPDNMENYLNDSYDSISSYADGNENSDKPDPVVFRWKYLRNDKADVVNYTLRVSENLDMTDALDYTVINEDASIYNLKTGTTYYWTVTANYADSSVTSPVSEFTTNAQAPRVLYVDGIKNVRDLGGWTASDGKKVKQGLIYRSMALSDISDDVFRKHITADGISTMKNKLGIKSEIDIRQDSEMPLETYTESVLGEDVNYFRYPMDYEGDYLGSNKAAIQSIFAELADTSNYPIVYHCAAGADRTGVISYLLNGLLGVSKEDLLRDYLITNFAKTDGKFRPISTVTDKYVATLDAYRGDTLREKIYNYLSEVIEVPANDLDFIISYMTE